MEITVIGAGIAGLTAAITAAEEGQPVRLLEKRPEPGGRARTLPPPYRANLGPHALYADGSNWQWLAERALLPATVGRGSERLLYSRHGELIAPPPALGAALQTILRQRASADRSFSCWAEPLIGPDPTRLLAGLAFIVTYDADAGRLSAAFVAERLTRLARADVVRYVVGGWQALIARLAGRAAQLGVLIQTRARVSQLPQPPAIVATSAAAARHLLAGSELRSEGARVALLDLALASQTTLPAGLLDLGERLYLARYTAFDRSLAPEGTELIQIACGCRPQERYPDVQARIDRVLDRLQPGWRAQLRWSRRSLLADAAGALDLPGQRWPGRPAIHQGSGVYLAGDYVAAPGLLSEVSFSSGRDAGLQASREGCR